MEKIILANWKANLSPKATDDWIQGFVDHYQSREEIEVVLAVPFFCMTKVFAQTRDLSGVCLAAQGVSPYPGGNYTGATPASWLQGLVRYAMIGHRERRKYFHETVQDIAAQVRECVAVGIKPILCLGDEGVAGIRAALDGRELESIIPAYTPDSAVALEKVREIAGLKEGIARLNGYFPNRPVLYGGGVDGDNGEEILALPEVAGVMLGRGCLDVKAFKRFFT